MAPWQTQTSALLVLYSAAHLLLGWQRSTILPEGSSRATHMTGSLIFSMPVLVGCLDRWQKYSHNPKTTNALMIQYLYLSQNEGACVSGRGIGVEIESVVFLNPTD